jgi:hypothetical protein
VHTSKRHFIEELKKAGQEFCSRTWADIIEENNALGDKKAAEADLVKYCFATAYSVFIMSYTSLWIHNDHMID